MIKKPVFSTRDYGSGISFPNRPLVSEIVFHELNVENDSIVTEVSINPYIIK